MKPMLGRIGSAAWRDERGGVLAFVAVTMIVLLAVIALCVDLAIAFTARGEAQRVADAAALGAASAFIDISPPEDAVDEAKARAKTWGAANNVRNRLVNTTDVSTSTYLDETEDLTVLVIPDSQKVRVWVRRSGLGVFFSTFLGMSGMNVQAMSAAITDPVASSAKCVKPFILFDMWDENQSDTSPANNLPDPGEEWSFQGPGSGETPYDIYEAYGDDAVLTTDGTGWGSSFRNTANPLDPVNDRGRIIEIKRAIPSQQDDSFEAVPGIYLPWRMPDPNASGGACTDTGQGGDFYRTNIETCNICPIELSTDYLAEPGGMVGPTAQGIRELLSQDPNAFWNPETNAPQSPNFPGAQIQNSPRMMVMALAAPGQKMQGAAFPIQFNNIVTMWLEDFDNAQGAVVARFVGPASGLGDGDEGELLKVLRLVE
jgi:hypothetical protein